MGEPRHFAQFKDWDRGPPKGGDTYRDAGRVKGNSYSRDPLGSLLEGVFLPPQVKRSSSARWLGLSDVFDQHPSRSWGLCCTATSWNGTGGNFVRGRSLLFSFFILYSITMHMLGKIDSML